jgi:hypothetical protein
LPIAVTAIRIAKLLHYYVVYFADICHVAAAFRNNQAWQNSPLPADPPQIPKALPASARTDTESPESQPIPTSLPKALKLPRKSTPPPRSTAAV